MGRDDNDGHFDIPFRRLTLHRCNTSTSSEHLNSMGKVADSSPCNQICSSSFSDCRNGAFQGDLNRRRRAVRLIAMDRHQAAAGASIVVPSHDVGRPIVFDDFGGRWASPLGKLPVNHHHPLSILAVSLDGRDRL